jgi:hypothetical protein
MAFPQIETGYKPEFGLGALYQGFNAANADQMSEQDILKVFLANQREQQQQPLDTLIKQWEAAHAQDRLNSPEFRNSMLQGYKGLMNSQIAQGKKAMNTVDSEIPAINQDNENRLFMGKTLADWNKLRLANQQQPEQSQIGFNTNIQGEPNPIGNIAKESAMRSSMGNDYRNTPDMPAASYQIKEINSYLSNPKIKEKDKQDLLKEKQRIISELNGQIPVLSNMTQQPQEQVQQPDNNLLSKFQNVLVNTPEQLQHLARIQEQGKNAKEVADTRGQYLVEAAIARLQKQGEKPLTLDQAVSKATRIIAGMEEGDKQAATIVIQEAGNYGLRKNPMSWQGNALNLPATAASGAPINSPSAVQQAGITTAPGYSPVFSAMVNGSNKTQQQSNLPPGVTIKK